MAAQGRPLVDIVDAVTRDGLTTKRGRPLSIQTMSSKLVRNPLYCWPRERTEVSMFMTLKATSNH